MLIIDQLKKSDDKLRLLAIGVLGGLGILLAGLWYVQVVASRHFKENLRNQSFRTIRMPAARGKILDRNGAVLAENQPSYNINLYLDELRDRFQQRYQQARLQKVEELRGGLAAGNADARPVKLSAAQITELARLSRFLVVSNTVQQVSQVLHQSIALDADRFHRHYTNRLALPLTVLANLNFQQIAFFQEQSASTPGLDLEVLPVRVYPHKTAAAHVLGFLRRDDSSMLDEDASFNYRLPDYKGVVGIEAAFDQDLHGKAGVKSVLVNNLGYRQSENVWAPAEPGKNIVLTLDLRLQQAAEAALRSAAADVRGAVVVLDGHNGDLLALVSAPAFDPNDFVPGVNAAEWQRLNDPQHRPMVNRATKEIYAPGSIFKIVTALAALETGLDVHEKFNNLGVYMVGKRPIKDTAEPGDYDFRRAFKRSSNSYFIHHGLKAGIDEILKIGARLHLGEKAAVPLFQESAGIFPTRAWQKRERGGAWFDGDTANLCIGQGDIAVTPVQMAVMTAAIANGGRVFWPRIVERLEFPDPSGEQTATLFPTGRVRDDLGVHPRSLEIVREGMFADVDDLDGTGRAAAVAGLRIGAKTGTAQVMQGRKVVDDITWIVSFAPSENHLYVVVVMVESGRSGGVTCAPVAQKIYKEIQKLERQARPKPETLAASQN